MRTLKYFGIQAEKLMAFDIFIGIAYGVIFGAMLSDGSKDLIRMIVIYMLAMGIITIIVTHSSLVNLNMPLALSMGGQRKEVFLGAQWTTALLIVQFLILFSLTKMILPEKDAEYMALINEFFPYVCITGAVLSEILAILTLKFGRKGTMIGTVVMSLAGTFSVLTASGITGDFYFISYLYADSFKALLLVSLIVLYAVITAVYYYIWKKYELRAF